MTWFTPKCPVDDKDRVWLEQASAWLIKEFQIRIEHDELSKHLPFFESSERGAAGEYMKGGEAIRIRISTAYLGDPMALVAVIAHELGHVLMLADKKVFRERKDHEHLTDLLTVLLGLGIFTADSAFRFRKWAGGGKQGWEAKRLGYLNEQKFGYALALFAHARCKASPNGRSTSKAM